MLCCRGRILQLVLKGEEGLEEHGQHKWNCRKAHAAEKARERQRDGIVSLCLQTASWLTCCRLQEGEKLKGTESRSLISSFIAVGIQEAGGGKSLAV